MKIEPVAFYAEILDLKRGRIKGYLHIKIPELKIEIRGLLFLKKNNICYLYPPVKSVFDLKENKDVRFPCFCFSDKDFWHSFLENAKIVGEKFLKKLEKENKLEKTISKSKNLNKTKKKSFNSSKKSFSKKSFKTDGFIDLPPRKKNKEEGQWKKTF